MLKHLTLFIFFLIIAAAGKSQGEPDSLEAAEVPQCEIIAYNSTNFIMYYFARQDLDSAGIVLNDWEAACGTSEPIMRTRILLSIFSKSFSEAMSDSTAVDYVLEYLLRMESDSVAYINYPEYFGFVPVRGEYDYFTQSIADTLLKWTFYNPAELYFSELYAYVLNEPMAELQHDTIFRQTELKSFYDNRVNKYRNQPEFNFNVFTGIWMPSDNASLLGNHPVFGCQAGYHKQKMTYNVALSFRIGQSKNYYEFLHNGYIDSTRNFLGVYIGADFEREILKFRKNEIDLLAGAGYEGFDAVKVNTDDTNTENDVSHPIGSVNINFGLGYRHYLPNGRYFALQGKYNFVNYDNHGGTNLSGNSTTISLLYGGFRNENKYRALDELRYKE